MQQVFPLCPNTSLPEAAPTASVPDATRTLSTSAQYFSTRGCANDNATSLREAAPTTSLSTSQYKCPMPSFFYCIFHLNS
ncbi:MAG: hypothetical protein ACYTXA_12300 [Nostoc sp.]